MNYMDLMGVGTANIYLQCQDFSKMNWLHLVDRVECRAKHVEIWGKLAVTRNAQGSLVAGELVVERNELVQAGSIV